MLPRTLLYCTENVAGIHAYELSIQCWAIIGLPLTVSPIKKVKVGPLCQNIMPPHARIQEFSSRGGVWGGGPGHLTKKALTTCFFFVLFLFFLSTADLTDDKWSISKKSIIFQGSRGGPTFSGGGGGSNFFQGGSNCLFPIETHITCDFPGGPDPLSPPLDPHCQPEEIFYFKVSQWVHSSDSGLLLTM